MTTYMNFGILNAVLGPRSSMIIANGSPFGVKIYTGLVSNMDSTATVRQYHIVGVYGLTPITLPSCPREGLEITQDTFAEIYSKIALDINRARTLGYATLFESSSIVPNTIELPPASASNLLDTLLGQKRE